jgi:hypothetical protein
MDMTGANDIAVSYKWAYSFKGNDADADDTDDRLKVYASSDCGETWVLRRMHRGFTDLPTADPHVFPFVPNGADEWTSHVLTLTQEEYFSPNFRIMFEFESRLGNNIYLDDINIQASIPAGVAELAAGASAPVLVPNPAADGTACVFSLRTAASVRLEVWDASGRQVRATDAGDLPAGAHRVNLGLRGLAPGVYLVRMVENGVAGRPARLVVE